MCQLKWPGIAGVVDLAAQLRRQRVIPRLGEQRAPILPHAGGPVAFQAVERDLQRAGVIAEPRDVPRDFLREVGVGEKHLVVVIHQLGHGLRRRRAAAARVPQAPRWQSSSRHGASAETEP